MFLPLFFLCIFIPCSFLQDAQHFLELDIRRVHQLEGHKHEQKSEEADVRRLDAEILNLKEALASKEKELADLKLSHSTKIDSLKEHVANSQDSANALRIAKEEAFKVTEDKSTEVERLKENHNSIVFQLGETHAAEISKLKEDYAAVILKLRDDHASEIAKLREDHTAKILSLQEKHDFVPMDERTHGYNEAVAKAADDVGALTDRIYRGGYEFGFKSVGVSRDHELFGKVILCLPGAFVVSSSSDSKEENEEEENAEDPPPLAV